MTKKKIMVLIQSGPQYIWSGICELVFQGTPTWRGEACIEPGRIELRRGFG